MALLTLAETKLHLRVDGTEEDDLISTLIDAAEEHIAVYLNDENYAISPPIKAAALLIIGDLFENRSAQIVGSIISQNPAVDRLLHPYRKGLGI